MHAENMKENAKSVTGPHECFTEYDQAASIRLENYFTFVDIGILRTSPKA